MKFLLKSKIRKAINLFDSWKIEEADTLLSDLENRHPGNDEIKFHLARTQNSLGNRVKALTLLEECIKLNPKNENALFIMAPVLLELADKCNSQDLVKLKEKFLFLSRIEFDKIGFDLASVFMYLAEISKKEGDYKEASHYMRQAKNLYMKDEFLKKAYVDSGEIDKKINEVDKLI